MQVKKILRWLVICLILAGCSGPMVVAPASTPTAASTAAKTIPVPDTGNVSACPFVPGKSIPAVIEAQEVARPTLQPLPTAISFSTTAVDAVLTRKQMEVFQAIVKLVEEDYVYEDFVKEQWPPIRDRYEALIQSGLSDEDFHLAMTEMVISLGDRHSSYLSPQQKAEDERMRARQSYVGVGVTFGLYYYDDQAHLVLSGTFPGGPAEQAGLKSHDALLAVDGGPVLDEHGMSTALGPEGSEVTLTVQSPGQSPRDVRVVRRKVIPDYKVEACMFSGTRIGYIRWITFDDTSLPSKVQEALLAMTVEGPLDGLVLDLRLNVGGELSVLESVLGYFTSGHQGNYVTRGREEAVIPSPRHIKGSQDVPLVVLVDSTTMSAAELFAGTLQTTGRARVAGQRTAGETEIIQYYELPHESVVMLATTSFQPKNQAVGAWDGVGVTPDVLVPGRWDQFTEANDPGVAKALEMLSGK